MSIPSPNDVSAEWLGACLEKAGHAGVRVRSFSQKRIGTGQIGQCIRYELDLEGGDGSAPTSLVGKFASDDPTSRQTGIQLRNYKKEIEFYRELQQRLTISTPRCYYAEIDGDGPEFALLLEDLAPAEQGDQLAGCDTGVARAALLELVGLHAPSWCDASLREVDWIGEPSDQTIAIGRMLYQAQLPGFLDRYGSRLEADERDIIAAVAESKGPPYQKLGDVYSLVHIDYRLDNLLIDGRGDPPGITVVDWQSVGLGHPLVDVSYFLGAGLLPEVRRREEEGLVRAYHEGLQAAGRTDYDWESCWTDYRRGVFSGFAVTVVASMLVQETERGNEMFVAMARRHSRQALDLGSAEFLG